MELKLNIDKKKIVVFLYVNLTLSIFSYSIFIYQNLKYSRTDIQIYFPYLSSEAAGLALQNFFPKNFSRVIMAKKECYILSLKSDFKSDLDIKDNIKLRSMVEEKIKYTFKHTEKKDLRFNENNNELNFISNSCELVINDSFSERWRGLIVIFFFNILLSQFLISAFRLARTKDKNN
jgi:hypothetical protein